jgi:hypothetical protein
MSTSITPDFVVPQKSHTENHQVLFISCFIFSIGVISSLPPFLSYSQAFAPKICEFVSRPIKNEERNI